MKLRNKKTGEIVEATDFDILSDYRSLTEFNEEWEDYEEPKEHWAIDQFGEPINVSGLSRLQLEKLHRLGNDFPSENATMKAIEKLKAWKRLKDKGFRFDGWTIDDGLRISICTNTVGDGIYDDEKKEMKEDLDDCFGGEE